LQHPKLDGSKVFVHGRSLGGAVTSYVMTQNVGQKVAGVILENTFTSIGEMVDVIFPKLRWFKNIVQRNYWPTADRVPLIRQPILFVICKSCAVTTSNER
jgi:alpha-beta hydrolase superfamily lysophospholipase